MTPENEFVMIRLRAALEVAYGERLRRVILFGSRACGDHRPDFDFDLAVVLDRIDDWSADSRRLRTIADDALDLETARPVSARPLSESDLAQRTHFMHEVRREGVAV